MVKAAGAKSEEIMQIQYTAGNTVGTGKIILEGINATNINYEMESLGDISKEIKIESVAENPGEEPGDDPADETKQLNSIEITKAPTKTTYTEGEKFDKTGMIVTAKYTDGSGKVITNYTYTPEGKLELTDTKITISYTEEGITKTAVQTIKITEAEDEGNTSGGGTTGKDNTVTDKDIPDTGVEKIIIPIAVVAILAALAYIRNKKYRNI